jgi:purine nucleoside permease
VQINEKYSQCYPQNVDKCECFGLNNTLINSVIMISKNVRFFNSKAENIHRLSKSGFVGKLMWVT